MKMNNNDFGGFIVSKNIMKGFPIKYSYREKSSIPELNGWTIYSTEDNDVYVNDSQNFVILSAESIQKVAPVLLEIFNAPYGTDLCWLYKAGVHIGFYDLTQNEETTIEQILKTRENE